jgi:hypothetical protein
MSEGSEHRPEQHGGENPGVDDDVTGRDEPGRRQADTTPPVAEQTNPGQTASPSHPEEAGIPDDEEMNRDA